MNYPCPAETFSFVILWVKVNGDRNRHDNISIAEEEDIALRTITHRTVLRKAAFQRAAQQSDIRKQHLPEVDLILLTNRGINPFAGARAVDTVCAPRGGLSAAAWCSRCARGARPPSSGCCKVRERSVSLPGIWCIPCVAMGSSLSF